LLEQVKMLNLVSDLQMTIFRFAHFVLKDRRS